MQCPIYQQDAPKSSALLRPAWRTTLRSAGQIGNSSIGMVTVSAPFSRLRRKGVRHLTRRTPLVVMVPRRPYPDGRGKQFRDKVMRPRRQASLLVKLCRCDYVNAAVPLPTGFVVLLADRLLLAVAD